MFLIWPLALDGRHDFKWRKIRVAPRKIFAKAWKLKSADVLLWHLCRTPITTCAFFIIISLLIASFPGEPHVNLLTLEPVSSVQCGRWFESSASFDRFYLPQLRAIDEDKLGKFLERAAARDLPPSESERTHTFGDRDFSCGDLRSADLRLVDLRGATLIETKLTSANLDGASLDGSNFERARLVETKLPGASLNRSNLKGANLARANLNGAVLHRATLQGANLIARCFKAQNLVLPSLRAHY
jgi:hypothetical protein